MDLNLKNKRALVCASSSGLGLASARELATLGARITLVGRNQAKLEKAMSELTGQGHNYLQLDQGDHLKLQSTVAAEIAKDPYLILINNTAGPAAGAITQAKTEDLAQAFHQHLLTAHLLTQMLLPAMKAAAFGRIINITSTSVKQPLPNLGVSNSIRGAVANWSKSMANELASFGITVNLILPGATETDRLEQIIQAKAQKENRAGKEVRSEMIAHIPAGRFGRPEEIGAAVAFLCSPAAAYINGVALAVDGGRTGNL